MLRPRVKQQLLNDLAYRRYQLSKLGRLIHPSGIKHIRKHLIALHKIISPLQNPSFLLPFCCWKQTLNGFVVRTKWAKLFYVYVSVHRWSILKIVQRDATQNSLFNILQVHSTYFGSQPHPSWVHKTATTASGTGHIFCAATSLQRGQASLASTGSCSYSFVYSSRWVWLTPETYRANLQNNK